MTGTLIKSQTRATRKQDRVVEALGITETPEKILKLASKTPLDALSYKIIRTF